MTLRHGLLLAVVALAMTTIGAWGPPLLLAFGALDPADQLTALRVVLVGNALALVGFIPLLLAALALVDRPALPAWLLRLAIGLLLVRPAVVVVEAIASPVAVVPPSLTLPIFLTTAAASGVAAISVLPTSGPARRPERIAVVGLGVAALVGLALFGYTGAIVPVAAMGLVIALALRIRREREQARFDELHGGADR
ncbi:hypothetical protein GCM10009792_09930 [Microcella alkalica]|uniref:Uncharacterized protein n=1 Tax=Microcella alkalica TaxID=355930 RepID=A0A839EDJ3_9MICO|nr:hypothetical protein [Microcella alkalica]MBA8848314.1 hypothetical protein [Microcella alkalica]